MIIISTTELQKKTYKMTLFNHFELTNPNPKFGPTKNYEKTLETNTVHSAIHYFAKSW